jgi:cell division transport system permease protein
MFERKPSVNRLKAKPAPAAERAAPRARLSFASWREQHLYSLFSSLGRLLKRPWATALTVLVMGLALALPLLFLVLLDNARGLAGSWEDAREITVFLKPAADDARAEALAGTLRVRADVRAVARRTPAQGLDEFRQMSGFAQALDVLDANPLPQMLIITPRDGSADADPAVLPTLKSNPDIDLVQYDATWRRRLGAILGLGTRAVQVLAGLLALGALLVVGNTVRLDIAGRREEIAVLQLIGASDGFVRRPFLYTGLWYGILAGLVTLAVLLAVQFALAAPVAQLLQSYEQRFSLRGLAPALAVLVPLGSAALGWLGAMLATARHLAEGRPE